MSEDLKVEKKKTKVTQPWKPASILQVNMKSKDHRPRWCRKDILDKKKLEGWEPIKWSDADAPEKTIIDGSPMSAFVEKRGLILCRMPEEMAKSREKYYKEITDRALPEAIEQFKGSVEKPTGTVTLTV
jgi:hypothetical protein